MPDTDSTLQRLILLIESNLHFVARQDMTSEQARDIQERMSRPLGALGSRFGFRSNRDAKNTVYQNTVAKRTDIE